MAHGGAASKFTLEPGFCQISEEIRQLPMLELHEEVTLAKRWREHGDRAAEAFECAADLTALGKCEALRIAWRFK